MKPQLFPSSLLRSIITIILFIILIFINQTSYAGIDSDKFTMCKRGYACGFMRDIKYPFWGDDTPSYCGLPGFKLNCSDGDQYPTLDYATLRFRVQAINHTDQIMTLARKDLWANSCPDNFYNTTLDYRFFDYHKSARNLTLFYNCTSQVPKQAQTNFTCRINGRQSGALYGNQSFFARNGLLNYTSSCSISIQVPGYWQTLDMLMDGKLSLQIPLYQGFDAVYGFPESNNCSSCEASGGVCGSNSTLSGFVCLCHNGAYPLKCPTGERIDLKMKIGIGSGVAIVGILFIFISIYCFRRKVSSNSVFCWKGKMKNDEKVEAFIRQCGFLGPKRYTYLEVKKITNSFKDKLGQGGFGDVYRGMLHDGRPVAAKVLNTSKGNGEDFINEVASISQTSHMNVVALLGFCLQGRKRALLYEFMPNGSLEKFIYNSDDPLKIGDDQQLGYKKLHQIAVGIAQGLDYLHQKCHTRILHFDIKPNNILLDEDFCPKISDFGLAKLCPKKESKVSMFEARGTTGYIAPEVFMRNFGGVSYKSDVYSYGMMVLEMVGGRKNLKVKEGDRTSEIYFPHWVYNRLELDDDLRLQGVVMNEEENKIARKMILVGLWCIQTNPSNRPSMSEVINMLEGSIDALQIPPKPFLYSPPISPLNSLSPFTTLEP